LEDEESNSQLNRSKKHVSREFRGEGNRKKSSKIRNIEKKEWEKIV